MASNISLNERARRAVAPGVSSAFPSFISRAEGSLINDVEGNEYIDFATGFAVTSLGHGHPRILAAAKRQVDRFVHTSFSSVPYESYIEVCEALIDKSPGTFDKRGALFTTGAEAVENAVKISRRATGRPGIAALTNGFHGRTHLTMSLTAKEYPFKQGFGPFSSDVYRAPGSYPLYDGTRMSGVEAGLRAIEALERQVSPDQLACFVFEPIQGEAGVVVFAEGFLSTVVDWCRRHGIVVVADEIQVGMCRSGKWFASETENIVPDLLVVAKALANGFPLSAVVGKADVIESVHPGGLGGTYAGNPVSCAVASEVFAIMEEEDFSARARNIETVMRSYLEPIVREGSAVSEVRGRGAVWGIELDAFGSNPAGIAERAVKECYERGLLVGRCGEKGNSLRILPSLAIETATLNHALERLTESLGVL